MSKGYSNVCIGQQQSCLHAYETGAGEDKATKTVPSSPGFNMHGYKSIEWTACDDPVQC